MQFACLLAFSLAAWPWLLLAHLLLPLRLLMALEEEAQEEVVGRGLLVEATRARACIGSRSSSTGTRKRFRSNESI